MTRPWWRDRGRLSTAFWAVLAAGCVVAAVARHNVVLVLPALWAGVFAVLGHRRLGRRSLDR